MGRKSVVIILLFALLITPIHYVFAGQPTPPTDITANTNVCAFATVVFTASGATDPDGGAITYKYLIEDSNGTLIKNWTTNSTLYISPALYGHTLVVSAIAVNSTGGESQTYSKNFPITCSLANLGIALYFSQQKENLTADITVKNTGSVSLGNISVKVILSGPESDSKTYTIPQLMAGGTYTIVYKHTPSKAGQYSISVTVDPNNQIPESNEQDNSASASVYFLRGRYLEYGGKSLWLVDEYAPDLSQITATFLDASKNTVGSTVISPSTTSITIPSNAVYLVLRSNTLERYIYLPGISGDSLSFASNASTSELKTTQVYIFNKDQYDVLTVKSIDGKIVARYELSDFSTISFTGVIGRTYIFQLEKNGTVKYSQSVAISNALEYITIIPPGTTPTNGTVIILPSVSIQASYNPTDKTITGTLTSTSPVTGTIKIELYSETNNTLFLTATISNFTNKTTISFSYTVPSNISGFSYARIIAQTDIGEFTKTILSTAGIGSLIPQKIFPNGLRIIIFGAIGLFALARMNIEVSATLTALILTIARIAGLVQISNNYLVLIYGLASSMFLFTKIRDKD